MIGLSKTTLELFKECPRCFWLAKNTKLARPKGIMPGVVNGIDTAMKAHVEAFVMIGRPVDYLKGFAVLPFPDRARLMGFRSWRTFQTVVCLEGKYIKVWGELDDLLVDKDEIVSPWDYKSKRERPQEGYSEKYYQLQGDLYHLLLKGQGFECSGDCYFTYAWPDVSIEGTMVFDHLTLKIRTNPENAERVVLAATKCLEGSLPKSPESCETCRYLGKRAAIDEKDNQKTGEKK